MRLRPHLVFTGTFGLDHAHMGISMGTVRTYTQRIYEKLHVHTRTEAVVKYLRN